MSLISFQKQFSTEEACHDHLFSMKRSNGFVVKKAKESPDHLNWLHTVLSNAKAFVGGMFHGLDSKHLQS